MRRTALIAFGTFVAVALAAAGPVRLVGAAQVPDGHLVMTAGEAPALAVKVGRGGPSGTFDTRPSVRVLVVRAGGLYEKGRTYDLAHSELVVDLGDVGETAGDK